MQSWALSDRVGVHSIRKRVLLQALMPDNPAVAAVSSLLGGGGLLGSTPVATQKMKVIWLPLLQYNSASLPLTAIFD